MSVRSPPIFKQTKEGKDNWGQIYSKWSQSCPSTSTDKWQGKVFSKGSCLQIEETWSQHARKKCCCQTPTKGAAVESIKYVVRDGSSAVCKALTTSTVCANTSSSTVCTNLVCRSTSTSMWQVVALANLPTWPWLPLPRHYLHQHFC